MLRPFSSPRLAFAVPLASVPVCAGGFTPTLAADPVGSFLGVSVTFFAAALPARRAGRGPETQRIRGTRTVAS